MGHLTVPPVSPTKGADPRSSPPLVNDHISLEELCEKYSLTPVIRERLIAMEVEPGDDLSGYSREDWEVFKFQKASWERTVKAFSAYKKAYKQRKTLA